MTSPTERTLKLLRSRGMTTATVERWNPHARIRQDLFGFADLVGCVGDADRLGVLYRQGIYAIQACAAASHAARRTKILAEPKARIWLDAGGYILLVSWGKKGARGKRKLWEPREERLTLADFDNPTGDRLTGLLKEGAALHCGTVPTEPDVQLLGAVGVCRPPRRPERYAPAAADHAPRSRPMTRPRAKRTRRTR